MEFSANSDDCVSIIHACVTLATEVRIMLRSSISASIFKILHFEKKIIPNVRLLFLNIYNNLISKPGIRDAISEGILNSIKKNSYERRDYESVDEKSMSWAMSRKRRKIIIQAQKGYRK